MSYCDESGSKYEEEYHSNLLSNPMVVTKAISKAIDSNKPKPRYLIGFAAKPLVFYMLYCQPKYSIK